MDTLDRGVLHVSEDWDCHSVRGSRSKEGFRCFSLEGVGVTQSRRLQRRQTLVLVVSSPLRSHEAKGEPLCVANRQRSDNLDVEFCQIGPVETRSLHGISVVSCAVANGPQ